MKAFKQDLQNKLKETAARKIYDESRVLAAVIVPFFEKNDEPHLLFTKRTNTVQHHRGEICFPGGSREENDRSGKCFQDGITWTTTTTLMP